MVTVFFFPAMLPVHMGDNHGIKLPEDLEEYNPSEYPHWHVFLQLHCGVAVDPQTMEENAKVIGSLTNEQIMKVTLEELEVMGLYVERSNYIV